LAELGDMIPVPEQLLGIENMQMLSDGRDAKEHNLILTLNPPNNVSQDQIKRAELNRLLHETKRLVCMSCKIVNARSIADLVGHAIDDIQLQNYKTLFQMNLIEDRKKLKENLTTLKEENIIRSDDEIIKLIAADIRDQHRLRKERKAELSKLKDTHVRLNSKVGHVYYMTV
jgi:DNA-binding transcriptional ArsR family regulator